MDAVGQEAEADALVVEPEEEAPEAPDVLAGVLLAAGDDAEPELFVSAAGA